jgi:acetyl esterase/lipase
LITELDAALESRFGDAVGLHLKSASGRSPLMVILPGGGYWFHADNEAEPIAEWLETLKIPSVVFRYPVAPHRHPEQLDAVLDLIGILRSSSTTMGIDAARIGVLGFSAGAHLAGLAATARSENRASLAVLGYPVVSMVTNAPDDSRENLMGAVAREEDLLSVSLEHRVTNDTAPMFMWQPTHDPFLNLSHTASLAAALAEADVAFELHIFQGGRHGIGLATEDAHLHGWTTAAAQWLRLHGWLADAVRR